MLNSVKIRKIRKLLHWLSWFILSSLISGSLYAYYYRVSYTNTLGERVNFYIKTNTFAGDREVSLNIGWLQQHSTFSSFGSLTVVKAPRYQVERVEVIDTLGHPVFNIRGGPVISVEDLERSTQDMGAVSQIDRNDAYIVNSDNQLSRAVLPVLQMIEGELSRPDIQSISRVNYENGGDQFDLYVHFISNDFGQDSSIEDNLHSLLNDLISEGVISAWRHRSRGIRQPEENMFTVVLSGLFSSGVTDTSEAPQQVALADNQHRHSVNNTYIQDRLRTLLARFLETNWNGLNSLAVQVGYSGAIYIALNDPQHENKKIIYDIDKIHGFSHQIMNRPFETASEDIAENRSTGLQWPPSRYSIMLSSGYRELIGHLRERNLATIHSNFNHSGQNWHSVENYLISSVFVSPPTGEFYQEVFSQRMRAIVEDIETITRKIDKPDLRLTFRFINIEDEDTGITRVNFMLESFITDNSQIARTEQLVRSIDVSTSFQTSAMRWHPVSISVQEHSSALSVTSAPLSEYFSPDPESGLTDHSANSTTPEYIPLDVFRNNNQENNEENCNCVQIRENRPMSE